MVVEFSLGGTQWWANVVSEVVLAQLGSGGLESTRANLLKVWKNFVADPQKSVEGSQCFTGGP